MDELSSSLGSLLVEKEGIGPSYVAVGIPQGVIVDRAGGEIAGAVRRGGELVSMDTLEYALWTILLTPMTLTAATEAASSSNSRSLGQAIVRLRELELLVAIEPGKPMGGALKRLRPLPLGLGLGNSTGNPASFEIQNATLSLPTPLSVDIVAVMFWWEFDGTKTLGEIAAHVASRLSNISRDDADTMTSQLAYGLMANRLLYLDCPAPQRGA
jgi:hypothetical protein